MKMDAIETGSSNRLFANWSFRASPFRSRMDRADVVSQPVSYSDESHEFEYAVAEKTKQPIVERSRVERIRNEETALMELIALKGKLKQKESEELAASSPVEYVVGPSLFKRWWGRILAVLTFVFVLPYLLTLLYIWVNPVSTLMLGHLFAGEKYQQTFVPIEKMSKNLTLAAVLSEDGRFCWHHGVDVREMKNVLADALSGKTPRGASTIPMQTAKNLFLPNSRSYVRKALEVPLAVWMKFVWSEQRIMEVYLNIAEFGPGIYGVEAASQHYFGLPASAVSDRQAALLISALPAPSHRNSAAVSELHSKLAERLRTRMRTYSDRDFCVQ